MQNGLREKLEGLVDQVAIEAKWRAEVTRGANLEDLLTRSVAAGVSSLLTNTDGAYKLDAHQLTMRAAVRIGAAQMSLAGIRNADTRREHACGLAARAIADCAYEMLAHQTDEAL